MINKKVTKVKTNKDLEQLLNRMFERIGALEQTVAELDTQVGLIVDAMSDEMPRGELDS